MPSNDPNAANLREQLRVGVRMLEALELQLKRAEDTIQREDDARRRAEEAITRLEMLESKLRRVIEVAHDAPTVPKPPTGISPSSGSLQASPRMDAQENQSEPSPQGAGNEQLARMLRRIAEQLITASGEKTDSPAAKTSNTSTGISVKQPVELDLGTSEATHASRD